VTRSLHVIVTARDEAATIAGTLDALRGAFATARIVVADDGSRDATAALAESRGAIVVRCPRAGKGQAATRGCVRALELGGSDAVYVLVDADLGASATAVSALATCVSRGDADIAIAVFPRGRPSGLGIALGFARWALRRATGRTLRAPLSGQRALSGRALSGALPFAPRFGLELAMTIDALRRGARIVELELPLEHRRGRRTPSGFRHRSRQLSDFVGVYARRAMVRQ